jgi:molybdenum cofactor cytidylyltransferase
MDRGVIASVIDGWRGGGGEIVAPSYRGVRAPPVIFSRSMFDELRIPRGDVGARALMDRHASRLMVIDVDCPPPADVDTSDDLARLEAERRRDR